ncbi:hypothetical protein GCM10009547_25700 [Sporichthya brevicatena]|uniref:Uncharacterized protein n=1 Tax=Sporichthya brevicatena TaxID=171442 RepID=A0ABP3S460_9ACTN
MSERVFVVHAERAPQGQWGLTVPEVPGAVSLVARLSQAEQHIREAISWVADLPSDSFAVRLVVNLSGDVGKELAEVRDLSTHAEQLAREAADRKRRLVGQLKAAGWSGSDIATVLEVSPQRVSQLIKG